jgi:hypothetical protein
MACVRVKGLVNHAPKGMTGQLLLGNTPTALLAAFT